MSEDSTIFVINKENKCGVIQQNVGSGIALLGGYGGYNSDNDAPRLSRHMSPCLVIPSYLGQTSCEVTKCIDYGQAHTSVLPSDEYRHRTASQCCLDVVG